MCNDCFSFLQENRFYGYVLYAINKSNSEKICIEEKLYFKVSVELEPLGYWRLMNTFIPF